MTVPDRRSHWEEVYSSKGESEVSWFEDEPTVSLEIIAGLPVAKDAGLIDVGGGRSRLVEDLASQGYSDLAVLDLSAAALSAARDRMGDEGKRVTWIHADITAWEPDRQYSVWHDRAAFHFLVEEPAQRAYVDRLCRVLRRGGFAVIGTFAPDGPEKCSGLPVARHDEHSLARLLPEEFVLREHRRHEHSTPWGAVQRFQFSTFSRS